MVEIVKHCAFGVPPIIIGHHLDEASFCAFLLRHTSRKWQRCNHTKNGIKIVLRMESKAWIKGWRAQNGRQRKLPCRLMFHVSCRC